MDKVGVPPAAGGGDPHTTPLFKFKPHTTHKGSKCINFLDIFMKNHVKEKVGDTLLLFCVEIFFNFFFLSFNNNRSSQNVPACQIKKHFNFSSNQWNIYIYIQITFFINFLMLILNLRF